jgi:type IV secretion system protein VirB3
MSTDTSLATNPFFGALTRPAMSGGVTFEYHMINMGWSVCTFIGAGNLLYGLIFLPLHACGWLVCRYDNRFFTLLTRRWLLPNMPNKSIWGVRTYEPY